VPRLRIVAVNDVYSLENLPRLHSLIEHHRATDPTDALLVTLAGDFVGPSILSSLDGGRGMVDCMNAIGVTHVTFGNHEDDIEPAELRARVAQLRGAWLGTNVRGFTPPIPSSAVVQVGDVKVGLLGVVMDDPSVYRRVPFGADRLEPPNEAALRETVRLLGEEGCSCVIPLTHQAADDDRALARLQRDPPFPIILGGHEHTPLLEEASGTWIVKAGSEAVHAVIADLVLEGGRVRVTVRLDDVAHYREDFAVRARVDVYMRKVHALEEAALVHLPPARTLSSVGTRARQTSLGTLVCTHVRDALDAEACLFNGGGIRAARDYEGRFTYGDLKAEVPFDNEVVVAELPGRVIKEAVAASRAHAPLESGGFLQVDDRAKVLEPEHTLVEIAGTPLVEERLYRVALVRDLLLGLDHIEPLVRFGKEHPESVPASGSGRDVKMVLVDAFSVALWRELGGFDAVDANHDGVVTEEELEAAVARAMQEAPSPVTAGLLIHALDADHDQLISRTDDENARRKH
jgi:2',3'-cyclic-nucleotide 2'-phosphodiesterase (5'-nucleotidase family)